MNLSLSQMDWIIKHCGYTQIAGFALAAAFFGLLLPCIFTGLACYWLGLLGAGFASWRIERGLWMLSIVFLFPTTVAIVWFLTQAITPIVWHGERVNSFLLDFVFASILFSYSLRFVLTSLIYNFKMSRLAG